MVIDSKAVEPGQKPKKTLNEELHYTFSSPLAWILVLALLITWSGVFVIMFDLVDYKTVSGRPPPAVRKVLKDRGKATYLLPTPQTRSLNTTN
ncbi:hypothetical protein CesoFtcFv8_022803 [Champsocephalus esox]|uniref:Triadin n=1 Tax=Champsocephalus esox TaxID=159716 RepID=A0AAN8GHT2_9TELE|nr:hypothetical protein CesoFtcFv8_022803 [Champsocephalus esox]